MKKLIATAISLSLAFSMAGCGSKDGETSENSGKITYWVEFANQSAAGVASYDELPVFQEIQNKLGVDIEFTHPVVGQTSEQLNLMLASRELPDIIQYQFYQYPGGAQKAIDDEVIISLNDIMDEYAPNLSKYLSENADVDKEVKTDEGNYYCFPNIYGDEYLLTYTGPIVRKDFLEKVGMERPETIDEWYAVLSAFKTQLNIESPFSARLDGLVNTFAQAFGVSGSSMYIDGGKVKYAPYEAGYKTFVETMRKWYSEGLIDKNIASLDSKTVSQNVLNSYTGATSGNTSGGIGKWMGAMKDTPEFQVIAAKYPVINKGDKPFAGHRINKYLPFGSASITTQCKNVELAAKVLDYGYSDEGRMLFNFGIEGEHYNMVDGYPTYSEYMTNNPDNALGTMISIYTRPNGAAPTIVDKRYMEQSAALPEQKESIELWSDADTAQHYMPSVNFTSAESAELSKLQNEIVSYQEQMLLKFITGVTDMSEYDAYLANLEKAGVAKYVEIYQTAYDRYLSK